MADLGDLPRVMQSQEGVYYEGITRTQAPSPARKLPTPLTINGQRTPRNSYECATAEIIKALNLDLTEYAEVAFARRFDDTASSVYLSPSDATMRTPKDADAVDSIGYCLTLAIAKVLDLRPNEIYRDESFVDMGGDQSLAIALQNNCLKAGLMVRAEDVLSCRTIAELETCVAPLSPPDEQLFPYPEVSPLQIASQPKPVSRFNTKTTRKRSVPSPLVLPSEAPQDAVVRSQLQPKASRRYRSQVESVLFKDTRVAEAAVLKPKAGPYEGFIVAFVTLPGHDPVPTDECEIKLLNTYYTGDLPIIRQTVDASVAPEFAPKVWVLLERMPVEASGQTDRRKLQTWIQNANEDLQRQIMSVDFQDILLPPSTPKERRLGNAVSKVLGVSKDQVGMNKSFSSLGGDETTAMKLVARCKSQGISISPEDVINSQSLTQLAALASPTGEMAALDTPSSPSEALELSPMQLLYFHTSMGNCVRDQELAQRSDYRFNQSMLLRLSRSAAIDDIHAAVEAVVGHHSMLRSRFYFDGASWSQSVLSEVSSSYYFGHHIIHRDTELAKVIEEAQALIDIENGPVFAAHHFQTHDGFQMLYLVAHHTVIDLRSWHVIIEDLEELLERGSLRSTRPISFPEWTRRQRQYVQSFEGAKTLPLELRATDPTYWGVSSTMNTYGRTMSSGFALGPEVTSLLEMGNKTFRTESTDVFIAALLLSFRQTFRDRAAPTIWNQEHDRTILTAGCDTSETVGWFTSLCPIAEDFPSDDIHQVISRVKDFRRSMPDRGAAFFSANLMDGESAQAFSSTVAPLEILFTYAGDLSSLEKPGSLLQQLPVPEKKAASEFSDIGSRVGRIAIFEISAVMDQGRLKFKFLFNQGTKHQSLIRDWIRNFEETLRYGIAQLQCQAPQLTASDMPLVDISLDGLAKLNSETVPALKIDVANVEVIYPANASQQQTVINQTLYPSDSISHTIYDLDSSGDPVDIGRICAAWQLVTQKYPALRTVFMESVSTDGLFDQVILAKIPPNMLFIESSYEDAAMTDLETIPPLALTPGAVWHRLTICQAPTRTLLKLEVSQALCDATSLKIVIRELEQVYYHSTVFQTFGVSYPEYFHSLKMTTISTNYWKEALHDLQPCVFPALSSSQNKSPDTLHTRMDLDLPREYLERFAERHELSRATILRVAWGLVLRVYVGSSDVCFGSRVSGRDIPVSGLKSDVGCFSNLIVTRLAVHSTQTIAQLLLDAEEAHHRSLDHQHVPISNVLQVLKMRDGSLFNTSISVAFDVPAGTKFSHMRTKTPSEFDLSIDVSFANGRIFLDIGHRIMNSTQAENIGHSFRRAVRTVIDSPGTVIREVDLFSEYDHAQVLAWNNHAQAEVVNIPVHQLVERKAAEVAEMPAICAWDGELSYGELNNLSKTFASYLHVVGVSPGSAVPIIMTKSRWAVVAMLAVLHAGAVIVPVDPEASSMLSWVVETMDASCVLTSEDVYEQVRNTKAEILLVNERTLASIPLEALSLPEIELQPNQNACVLFKSELTSSRKVITYTHTALATAFAGQGPMLMINASSRVMQLSPLTVDIALTEIFTTLVHGGVVCIPATTHMADFTSAATQMNVNWTYLTPNLSRKLQPEALPNLSVVCFRTRRLDSDTCAPWIGRAKVLLVYGSAESCPLGLSATEVKDGNTTSCTGRPFCGNFWIVNPENSNCLVPIGGVGELLISSATLGIGYDLDSQKSKDWLRASWVTPNANRLLRTGHSVRYREDGHIEIVSSRKSRGPGIPFAQIEQELRRCFGRGVDVVVETIAFKDKNSTPIVAAFIELGDLYHGDTNVAKISSVTKERLYLAKRTADMMLKGIIPAHMIPSAYVPVKRFPLTPSLKVDCRELQRMITSLSRTQLLAIAEVVNPQSVQASGLRPLPLTPTEEQVRAIWAVILDINESAITAEDGFMTLGGSYALAHNLVILCRQQGLHLPVVDVVRNSSLRELCNSSATKKKQQQRRASIMRNSPSGSKSLNASVEGAMLAHIGRDGVSIDDVAEASSLQTMLVESTLLETRGNVNYIMVNIAGTIDWDRLESACSTLASIHTSLRTVFVPHDGKLYQAVLTCYQPEFQRHQSPQWRLSSLVSKVIKKDQAEAVDSSRPVTKFFLFDGGKSSTLAIRLSRAQYDDSSFPMLLKDLAQLYDYEDVAVNTYGFCDVVRAAKQSSSFGAADYWRTLLSGSIMTQIISQSTPLAPSADSQVITQRIPTGSLQNLGIPFETILKGAWSVVLANLSGSNDVVFGQLVEGKNLSVAEGISASEVLGPSGNIIPVRTCLPDEPITPYEYLRSIQTQHAASLPHEHMQFSDIVEKCTPWPNWIRFSSVVQHLVQDDLHNSRYFSMGGVQCKLSYTESNHQNSDIFVRSAMVDGSNVHVSLAFSERRMTASFADGVLRMLCSTITLLTSAFMMEPLCLQGLNDNAWLDRIPLAAPQKYLNRKPPIMPVAPEQASAIHSAVSTAWNEVLSKHKLSASDLRTVPFFEIWGSLIPASELARYLSKHVPELRVPGLEHVVFSMEDIMENPTMMAQYEMILDKQQESHSKRRSNAGPRLSVAWTKNVKRLTSVGALAVPAASHSRSRSNTSSTSSAGSMTSGSSQSDEEELKEDMSALAHLSLEPQSIPTPANSNRTKLMLGKMGLTVVTS